MGYRISVDTGGTFTDVVVADEQGTLHVAKALTDLERAFQSIEDGLAQVAPDLGLSVAELLARTDVFTYGTTRATNAIVEGRTARTAFFTTEGFPDLLLLREGGKLDPFKQIPYPPPYVPRFLTFEIRERIDSEGDVFVELDEAGAVAAIGEARRLGAEAVAVCLLWSIVNPAHELRVGELLEREWPEVPFTLSHRLNPIVREYRRASSTAIDASLKPLMQAYLRTMEHDLRQAGLTGHIFIATSFGGAWRPQEVIERPIYSVGSGPSMAPVAALTYATAESSEEEPDLIVCDTGGTTFDVGLVSRGEINYAAESWLGGRWIGHITGIRAVDVKSIGAGGGSIVWIDPGGLIRVGPQSAGADPGPACYGRGGRRADDHRRRRRPRLDRPGLLPRRPAHARRRRGTRGGRDRCRRPARARPARGGVRGADDRVREHRRRDPGAHDRPGDRPARGEARRRRRRIGAQHRPHRPRARLPAGAAPRDRERPLRVRRAVRRHRLRVLVQPVRGDPVTRPRRRQRGAGRRRGARGRVPRRDDRASRDGHPNELPGRGPLPRAGVGARRPGAEAARSRTTTSARWRRCSTPSTSASSPSGSRASTWSACSGRRGPPPCSTSRRCGRESGSRPPGRPARASRRTSARPASGRFRFTRARRSPRERGSRGRRSSGSRRRPWSSIRARRRP